MISFLGLVSEPVTAPRSVARVSLNIFWPSRRSTHVPSKSEVCCATHILMAKIKIAPRIRLRRSASIQSDYVKKRSPSDAVDDFGFWRNSRPCGRAVPVKRPAGAIFRIFFFQAEDGIRDGRVTGVQTCALPI